MPDGSGLDPDEIERLDDILHQAGNELALTDLAQHVPLEGFLTTQPVSRYENGEETVLELTRFAGEKYPRLVEAMQRFVPRAHVTIENAVAARIREYDTGG